MLSRRLLYAGAVASLIYGLCLMALIWGAGAFLKPWQAALPAVLGGLAIAFGVGAVMFGLIPHYLGVFMASSSSMLELINRAALIIALSSVLVGVIAGLMLIFGSSAAVRPLLVAITLFLGASATMCSLKFFYINRGAE